MTTSHPNEQLIQLISNWVEPLGYQVVHLEIQSHRQRVLRLFIDFLTPKEDTMIGIEDCVTVSRALEERLDQNLEVEKLFSGTYELEVSSPGVDRPLRTSSDFERFSGQEARIHVYRPLHIEEIENTNYQEKNPKQKNFFGKLLGLKGNKVILDVSSSKSQKPTKKSKAKQSAELETNSAEGNQIFIPLPLISKANLEPVFDFESGNESE
jgi:ribosome maturation factor RimP